MCRSLCSEQLWYIGTKHLPSYPPGSHCSDAPCGPGSCIIDPIHFPVGWHRRRPEPGFCVVLLGLVLLLFVVFINRFQVVVVVFVLLVAARWLVSKTGTLHQSNAWLRRLSPKSTGTLNHTIACSDGVCLRGGIPKWSGLERLKTIWSFGTVGERNQGSHGKWPLKHAFVIVELDWMSRRILRCNPLNPLWAH